MLVTAAADYLFKSFSSKDHTHDEVRNGYDSCIACYLVQPDSLSKYVPRLRLVGSVVS
jgi:hypothetical protein